MIRIRIYRDRQNQPQRVTISGHADYREHGKDIVCAAVSGISIGIINAIEKLLGVQIVIDQRNAGLLDCQVPEKLDKDVRLKVLLLLEAMVVALSDVASEYPQYVQIKEIKKG